MKRWLKRKVRSLMYWAEDDQEDIVPFDDGPRGKNNVFYNSDYREFRIYRANSGYVVEVYHYRRNKEGENTLHIIRSDQELGDEISKILTLEELRT